MLLLPNYSCPSGGTRATMAMAGDG